jgi:hypothetical protein
MLSISIVHGGQAPEIVKVKPLQRRAPAEMFKPPGILCRYASKRLITAFARQADGLME